MATHAVTLVAYLVNLLGSVGADGGSNIALSTRQCGLRPWAEKDDTSQMQNLDSDGVYFETPSNVLERHLLENRQKVTKLAVRGEATKIDGKDMAEAASGTVGKAAGAATDPSLKTIGSAISAAGDIAFCVPGPEGIAAGCVLTLIGGVMSLFGDNETTPKQPSNQDLLDAIKGGFNDMRSQLANIEGHLAIIDKELADIAGLINLVRQSLSQIQDEVGALYEDLDLRIEDIKQINALFDQFLHQLSAAQGWPAGMDDVKRTVLSTAEKYRTSVYQYGAFSPENIHTFFQHKFSSGALGKMSVLKTIQFIFTTRWKLFCFLHFAELFRYGYYTPNSVQYAQDLRDHMSAYVNNLFQLGVWPVSFEPTQIQLVDLGSEETAIPPPLCLTEAELDYPNQLNRHAGLKTCNASNPRQFWYILAGKETWSGFGIMNAGTGNALDYDPCVDCGRFKYEEGNINKKCQCFWQEEGVPMGEADSINGSSSWSDDDWHPDNVPGRLPAKAGSQKQGPWYFNFLCNNTKEGNGTYEIFADDSERGRMSLIQWGEGWEITAAVVSEKDLRCGSCMWNDPIGGDRLGYEVGASTWRLPQMHYIMPRKDELRPKDLKLKPMEVLV